MAPGVQDRRETISIKMDSRSKNRQCAQGSSMAGRPTAQPGSRAGQPTSDAHGMRLASGFLGFYDRSTMLAAK
jgi:hypothetical protein